MTDKLKKIFEKGSKYSFSSVDLAYIHYGFDDSIEYDALVVAPVYTPEKLIRDSSFKITKLGSLDFCEGFLVEKDGLKIAWAKSTTGGGNMLDYMLICGTLKFKKLIFVGAVGALKAEFNIGDICIPSYCVSGTLANAYLKDSLSDYIPFEKIYPDGQYTDSVIELAKENGYTVKKASVFCTDSIVMEYAHLDEIRSFDTDLIEMETSVFYDAAKLFEVPAVALLVVSDNSATGVPLVGRSEEVEAVYDRARKEILPDLIYKISRRDKNAKA